ncbi:iron-containing alcohol dehydrogenase family protein [Jiangella mangrovi]|uniref:Alcohol dehydrogenase class IV n=1 Tax=Jiangella mangrovi TaxID=1524084 RepID=A0A7W9GUV9_9ACTN|nr:iron-containing alcohol dehydrogenase [Jiangella mangrovi]MBB5790208.1 alcohol dehydrogenase class IV [Jiangella mangrovi]
MTRIDRYAAPTELVYGDGVVDRIGAEIARLGGRRALVVTDAGLAGAGVADRVGSILTGSDGVEFAGIWSDVPQDPTFADVDRLAARLTGDAVDTVVSLGAGSVMAAGRSAAVAVAEGKPVAEVAKAGADGARSLLSVCVPTTAGSGGEVSRQATLTDDRSGQKSGVRGWAAAARLAVLDPELLVSVPRGQAIASGIDAMVHALEAYWSKRATPLTDALARPSFHTLVTLLPESLEKRDTATLGPLLLASTMANLACGNAGLGLVHGLNKGIATVTHTKHYTGLSYGMLHAVLLPWVLRYNAGSGSAETDRRLTDLADDIGAADPPGGTGGERLTTAITAWLDGLGAPSQLPWERCDDEDVEFIVQDTLGRPMWKDNARTATEDDVRELLKLSLTDWRDTDLGGNR